MSFVALWLKFPQLNRCCGLFDFYFILLICHTLSSQPWYVYLTDINNKCVFRKTTNHNGKCKTEPATSAHLDEFQQRNKNKNKQKINTNVNLATINSLWRLKFTRKNRRSVWFCFVYACTQIKSVFDCWMMCPSRCVDTCFLMCTFCGE